MTAPVDVLAVRLCAEPAGELGMWRGVAYVDGVAEFRTIDTYETKELAERKAQKLRLLARDLARENAAARAQLESHVELTAAQRRVLAACLNDVTIIVGGQDATPNVRRDVVYRLAHLGLIKATTPSSFFFESEWIITEAGRAALSRKVRHD